MTLYRVKVRVTGKTFYWAREGYPGFFCPKKKDSAELPKENAALVQAYLPSAMKPKLDEV